MSTKFMTGLALAAPAALGLAFMHPAQAQTSIQFQGQGTALMSGQLAGVIATSHYNVLTGSSGTSGFLLDNAGGSTLITATYAAAGTYFSNSGTGTANATLMSGYLDSSSTVGPTVTISGLDPTKSYSVYAYFNTDHQTNTIPTKSDRISSYTIGSTTFTAEVQPGPVFSTFIAAGTSTASPAVANYALFSNVTGSSFTLSSTPISSTDGYPRAPIDGLQIFTNNASAAPEPSQFASLGFTVLAVMGLILKARKRRSQGEAV